MFILGARTADGTDGIDVNKVVNVNVLRSGSVAGRHDMLKESSNAKYRLMLKLPSACKACACGAST